MTAKYLVFLAAAISAPAQVRLRYLDFGPQPEPCCVAADASGNVYVAGSFATVAGNGVTTAKILVVKVDRANQIVYRFMFGGSTYDAARGIAVDANGNVFVVGSTSSSDFPLVNALIYNPPNTLEGRGFISKIDPTGTKLLFSTFMGAEADAVTLDPAGNVYVTGAAGNDNFRVTPNAFRSTGSSFVLQLTNAGDQILFSTFVGPVSSGLAIAVGSDGAITVAGSAAADGFPVTPGAFQATCNCTRTFTGDPFDFGSSATSSFVARLSADGSRLLWATYLGGGGNGQIGVSGDTIQALALTSDGGVVVAGLSQSPGFPVTPGAFQTKFRAQYAGNGIPATVFVTRLNSTGTALKFSTFLGGSILEQFSGMQLDAQENVWVTGTTHSSDFPSLPNSLATGDEFVVQLAADGSRLLNTQMLPAGDAGQALALDASGGEILLGWEGSLLRIPAGGPSGISILAQVNAAAYSVSGRIAPGEIISLYGTGLGPTPGAGAEFDSKGKIASTLAGMQVTFDGTPAPLLYAGANQINAIVPFGVSTKASTSLQVKSGSTASPPLDLAVAATYPAIFSVVPSPPPLDIINAAALNQDGTVNSMNNPAKTGSIIVFWATGAGLFTHSLPDGAIVRPPLSAPLQPVSVLFVSPAKTVGVQPLYAGAAPGMVAGVLQVNVRLPQNLFAGSYGVDYYTLQLQVGDSVSAAVQIWVRP